MTVGISSTNTANAWLNVLRGAGNGVTFTAPAALTADIHTADPGASGTTAVSVGSATKVAIGFAAASAGAIAMSGTAPAWTNGGTSETLTHIAVQATATFYFSAALTASQAWASGNTFTLTACTVTITPLAA